MQQEEEMLRDLVAATELALRTIPTSDRQAHGTDVQSHCICIPGIFQESLVAVERHERDLLVWTPFLLKAM